MSEIELAIDRLAHWAIKSKLRLCVVLCLIYGVTAVVCLSMLTGVVYFLLGEDGRLWVFG